MNDQLRIILETYVAMKSLCCTPPFHISHLGTVLYVIHFVRSADTAFIAQMSVMFKA